MDAELVGKGVADDGDVVAGADGCFFLGAGVSGEEGEEKGEEKFHLG